MNRTLALFAIVVSVPFVLVAQSVTGTKTPVALTLKRSIEIALGQNTQVILAQHTVEAQQSNVLAAYGNLLPTVSASASWRRDNVDLERGFFQEGLGFVSRGVSSTTNSFRTSAGASFTIFDGFGNTASLNRARAGALSSEFSLDRTKQTVVFTTTQLYLNVLRTEQLLKVAQDNLKRSMRQLERIEESNRIGAVALADVYRQQVVVGNDEISMIQAKNNYDRAVADLVYYLGLNALDEYQFEDPSIPSDVDTAEFLSVNERYRDVRSLLDQALELRPDYQSAIENLNRARSGVTAARAGHFPTVSGFTSYALNSDEISALADNRTLTWGISLRLPIFNGWQIDNAVQQAKVDRKNAEETLSQAHRQIQVDLRKSLLDLEAAQKRIEVSQKSVQSAEEDRRIAEERYNLGAGTLLDLLTANAQYTTAVSNKVNAVYDYILAKRQMEYFLGTLTS
ncbi:MAG: TolC family protein [Bacteroidota bacterium]